MTQPAQKAKTDSRTAKTTSIPRTMLAAPLRPKAKCKINAVKENSKPMVWANRFGGPDTSFPGRLRRGASTFEAIRPIGLSVGPVNTLAKKPVDKQGQQPVRLKYDDAGA